MDGIFKAYDIRGIYPEQLDENMAEAIAKAFVKHTGATNALIGRDSRLSSPSLSKALIKGLLAAGTNVTDIGLCTTPMIKMMQQRLGYSHAIQVTASHNPKEYGGMKLYGKEALQITSEEGLPEIEALVKKAEFKDAEPHGKLTKRNVMDEYTDLLAEHVKEDLTELHVIVDASNGPAGKVCESLFPKINIQYTALNFEPDGNFPGHDPNPLKGEATKQAAKAVAEQGADLAVIFDADADRAIFIDEEGRAVPRGNIAALIAQDYLSQEPGAIIVHDTISSHIVKEAIEQAGGKPVLNRTGAAFIMHKMAETNAVFGCEDSGHYFYQDTNRSDHAVYTLLRVMRIVARAGKSLSELTRIYSTFFDSDQINIEVEDAQAAIQKVRDEYKEHEQLEIGGGVSIEFNDGHKTWIRAQPSNTEPLIRIRIESKDEKTYKELMEQVQKVVR